MNKLALTLVASIVTPFFFYAQSLKIEQSSLNYNGKLRPAIHVLVESASKDMQKAWKSFVAEKLLQKVKGSDLQTAEGVNIPQISDRMIDFYAKFEDNTPSGTNMYVFADKGNDQFLNPTDDATDFGKMEEVVKEFLRAYVPTYYSGIISTSESALSKSQKDLESATKSVDKNVETAQKNDQKIQELQKENSDLKSELETLKKQKSEAEIDLKKNTQQLSDQKSRFEAAKSVLMN